MITPVSLIASGILGIVLLMGYSVPSPGTEERKILQKQAGSKAPEAFPLKPINGLEEAKEQVDRFVRRIPKTGHKRALRLCQLARLYFFLGEEGDKKARKDNFKKGRYFARLLLKEQPQRVEGHYWLALNLCGLANVAGAKNGLKLLPRIVELLETNLSLDEAYDQAGPHRILGRIYFMAPDWPLSVGDVSKSIRHLSSAVEISPENSTNHLYLAETLFFMGEERKAYQELEKVLAATHHALWLKGLDLDRQKARELMDKYEERKGIWRFFPWFWSSLTDMPGAKFA
ncbi:MAG: TRAP transporter TatT component family protein [Deltaproteobacteria bacterium]|nr:TRAP transporter TatT component family protein [Deltaproteobacteria bacterium]